MAVVEKIIKVKVCLMEDYAGGKEWVGDSEVLFGAVAEMFGEGDSDTGVFGV